MKNIVKIFSLVLVGIIVYPIIIGFSFPTEKLPKSFSVTAISDKKEVELCVISEKNSQYQKFTELILKNETGWGVDFNSYMPSLRLYSNNMNVVMIDGLWVVNYESEYFGWVQLSKEVDSDMSKSNICINT